MTMMEVDKKPDMDKIAEISLLYDFYGKLLTEKQRQVMALYHEGNLSLSEIGEEFRITKQAVHDTLKKAEQSLMEYEKNLGLVDKFIRSNQAFQQIDREIDQIMSVTEEPQVLQRLERVRNIIRALEEQQEE